MRSKPNKNEYLVKKEAIRQWFEFYKIALISQDPKVRKGLESSAAFYEPWGDVLSVKFNDWWDAKAYLFKEMSQVRLLVNGAETVSENSVLIEVPLTESTTKLLKKIKVILDKEFEKRQFASKKSKVRPTHDYALSDSSEPKLAVVREKLTVYRDVYLKNSHLKGQKLLDVTRNFYSSRPRKKDIPFALLGKGADGDIRAMRNLRRYIQDAKKILLNVANGTFPGKY